MCGAALCTPAGGLRELDADARRRAALRDARRHGPDGRRRRGDARARAADVALVVARHRPHRRARRNARADVAGEERHRYSVAWLDLLAEGADLGRAVVTRSRDCRRDAPPTDGRAAASRGAHRRRAASTSRAAFPGRCCSLGRARLQRRSLAAAPRRERGRPVPLRAALLPARRARRVEPPLRRRAACSSTSSSCPTARRRARALRSSCSARTRSPIYLAVLKRFGAAFGGAAVFPDRRAGRSRSTSRPGARSAAGADRARRDRRRRRRSRVPDQGRCACARDLLGAMYPQLGRFEEQRALVDPDGVLRSDLGDASGSAGRRDERAAVADRARPARHRRSAAPLRSRSRSSASCCEQSAARGGAGRPRRATRSREPPTACRLRRTRGDRARRVDAERPDDHGDVVDEAFRRARRRSTSRSLAVGLLGERGGLPADVDGRSSVLQRQLRRRRVAADPTPLGAARAAAAARSSCSPRSPASGRVARMSSMAPPRRGSTRSRTGSATRCDGDGVRVLVVRPGFVRTRMTRGLAAGAASRPRRRRWPTSCSRGWIAAPRTCGRPPSCAG